MEHSRLHCQHQYLSNGDVFETADDTGPLHFQLGQDSVMSAFEKGILGMSIGETKTVEINAKNAYGEKNDELVISIDGKALGDDINPHPGMVLGLTIEKDGADHKQPYVQVPQEQVVLRRAL